MREVVEGCEDTRTSYGCMEGCGDLYAKKDGCSLSTINKFLGLQLELDAIFAEKMGDDTCFLESRRRKLTDLLSRCSFPDEEVAKYAKTSPQLWLPYTRNLVHENEHYTLLVLVWKAQAQSKIHSHPCDGCCITPLRGAISEKVFQKAHGSDNIADLQLTKVTHLKQGDVGFMSDLLGQYHKIESAEGCISLHLYTPPFVRCRIWIEEEPAPAASGESKGSNGEKEKEEEEEEEVVGLRRTYKTLEVGSQIYSMYVFCYTIVLPFFSCL
jgi:cysteine dioxygenase